MLLTCLRPLFRRFLTALMLLPVFVYGEGGKDLTPGNNGVADYTQSTPLNNTIGFLQNGDNTTNYNGFFLYSSSTPVPNGVNDVFNPNHRLKIRLKRGETLYYGLQRVDGVGNVRIRIMRMNGAAEQQLKTNTLTAAAATTVTAYGAPNTTRELLNAQPGVIGNRNRMFAGPSAVVGTAGYNALSYTWPAAAAEPYTDVWVELWDDGPDNAPTCDYDDKDVYDLWDFSVYAGTTRKEGRVFSKFWGFQAMTANNRLSDEFKLYPAIPNVTNTAYFIKGLNLRGMQPFGFSFVCNSTGTLTDPDGNPTTDPFLRRMSKPAGVPRTDVYTEYDIFLNNPDEEFWPTASSVVSPLPFTVNAWCADPVAGRGALTATIGFAFPANIQIVANLNGVPGYQPGTRDVLLEANRNSGLGQIYWDGRDGLGNIVPLGTTIDITYRVQVSPVHYPIFDGENNNLGFGIEEIRPLPVTGTVGTAYWDDSRIVAGSRSLIGTSAAAGVHPWGGSGAVGTINQSDIGNSKLFNTWSYGAIREMPLSLPFQYRCDYDGDGRNNNIDIDDDNDGILDTDESSGLDPLADADGDGVLNYVDFTNGNNPLAGFADRNFDGINDIYDIDGDKILNAFDLDSDNDGITDVIESYGFCPEGTGRIGNYADADGDGLSNNVDRANGVVGSLGLGIPDLDGDGIPNFLDKDSDNDGIPDIIEAGGTDANNNGVVDDLVEPNPTTVNAMLEGVTANPSLVESFADSDFDGLANSIDPDQNNDGVAESASRALLRSGVDANNNGISDNFPYVNFDGLGRPNAYDLDSDDDGITDVREAGFADTDNNGMADGQDATPPAIDPYQTRDGWSYAIDALVSFSLRDTDGDGKPDHLDIDSDNDGIPDNIEGISTAAYLLPVFTDTDGDGLLNTYDGSAAFGGNGYTPYNHDGDALPDYLDPDSDNDSIDDLYEGNDFNGNGKLDDAVSLLNTDADGDGLDDRFDANNASRKGTSRYIGDNGSVIGDASPGSRTMVQRSASGCAEERDWRCMPFVLPIKKLQLSGNAVTGVNTLKWEVLFDGRIHKFEVERSMDNKPFEKIGEIGAEHLLPNSIHKLTYTDNTTGLSGSAYQYRIKATDNLGKTYYSNLVLLNTNKVTISFSIHPNPIRESATLIVSSTEKQSIDVILKTALGTPVKVWKRVAPSRSHTLTLDGIGDLPSGIYYIEVLYGASKYVEKVVKY